MTQGAVIVMPRLRSEGAPAAGLWTLAAGWAGAAERRFGNAWIVTLDGVASADEVLSYGDPAAGTVLHPAQRLRHAPMVLRTAAKDIVRARGGPSARDTGERPEWRAHELVFVWQHHNLFRSPGAPLARRHACPFVSFVDAPQVWEARRWGVMRPGWGRLLERYGERPQLLASDVVACVSDEVAREVVRLGVSRERIVVSPTAVDAELFAPAESSAAERHALGVGDAFVVGWAGTFRRFQGLETLVEAFAKLRETQAAARLLLVGDGAERPHIEAVVDQVGARAGVVFAGATGARAVPECLNAMDVAVVSARSDDGFHYSPLKLREYLACGRAVLAPRIGEIPSFVDDGVHALLYEPGDVDDLATKLRRLHDDPGLRSRLGAAGRDFVLAHATWDTRLDELLDSAPFRAAVGRAAGSV